jgi:glycosyltransferase involved in cell wall biosynthesis
MYIFIFNNYFNDSSGFSKRCTKIIDSLSDTEKIIVLCKKRARVKELEVYKTPNNRVVELHYFSTSSKIIERINSDTYLTGYYELIRNVDLLFNLFIALVRIILKYSSQEKIKYYVVTSPLTIPFIIFLLNLLNKSSLAVVEFHDLEPEFAKHIKKLKSSHTIVKIELFIEKIVCNMFEKVIVTSGTQASILEKRTQIKKSKIYVLPNSIQVNVTEKTNLVIQNNFPDKSNYLVIGYISQLSYGYTIDGLLELIRCYALSNNSMKNIKLLIAGDGPGLELLKCEVVARGVDSQVIFLGKITNVTEFIQHIDIGLIPWTYNEVTSNILPTKLFEYMFFGKPVIAPNFNEFMKIIKNQHNGMIFSKISEIVPIIDNLKNNRRFMRKLGEEGKITVNEKFNFSKVIGNFTSFIRN